MGELKKEKTIPLGNEELEWGVGWWWWIWCLMEGNKEITTYTQTHLCFTLWVLPFEDEEEEQGGNWNTHSHFSSCCCGWLKGKWEDFFFFSHTHTHTQLPSLLFIVLLIIILTTCSPSLNLTTASVYDQGLIKFLKFCEEYFI